MPTRQDAHRWSARLTRSIELRDGTELDTLADVRPQQPSRYSVRVAPVLDRKGVALFGRDVVRRDRG
jgi:hypothetical protein